jgi:hypothetical protein
VDRDHQPSNHRLCIVSAVRRIKAYHEVGNKDDPEVKALAQAIYNSQEVEIKTMQDKLESMGASLPEEPSMDMNM